MTRAHHELPVTSRPDDMDVADSLLKSAAIEHRIGEVVAAYQQGLISSRHYAEMVEMLEMSAASNRVAVETRAAKVNAVRIPLAKRLKNLFIH